MNLSQIIYSSTPFGFDGPTLAGILMDSRRNNERDDITGALVCRADVFLQLLEGPKDKVEAAIARIKQDDRHVDVTLHVSQLVSERLFGAWAMLDDPARSWLWSQEQVAKGAISAATPAEISAVFLRLSAEKQAEA